jgi:hypothetical protein
MTRGPGEESVPTLAREQIDALVYGGRGVPPFTQVAGRLCQVSYAPMTRWRAAYSTIRALSSVPTAATVVRA